MKQGPVELEKRYLMQTYARSPIVIDRGKGCWLWDDHGKKYLDFVSGLGVNALGYSHPRILKALREQASKAIHVSNLYYHPYQGPLAAALAQITGMDRVFFCNSGTEAIEGAIKLARVHASRLRKKKYEIVALQNSFHGRTLGALSATGQAKYRHDFEPLLPGIHFVQFNDWKDLEAKVSDKTCAILVEPIQGEGGIFEVTQGFMKVAADLARRYQALLIMDEIQCGLGRTGRYLASRAYPVRPDMVVLAKPLGGGLPLGAFLAREEIAASLTAGMHGTTFGGGPLACRVALEFLAVLKEEKVLTNVRTVGNYFRRRLLALQKKYSFIREVRGRGLMLALDLIMPSKPFVQKAMERGIIINSTHETVLRFLPPLTAEKQHVDLLCKTLEVIFAEAGTGPPNTNRKG
ncbi:MAG: aspartate aminotransferase family protein [Acidobacteria bacterium]|nr:aspartate aminotransferase family protein [Acidobacteriota bacterium]